MILCHPGGRHPCCPLVSRLEVKKPEVRGIFKPEERGMCPTGSEGYLMLSYVRGICHNVSEGYLLLPYVRGIVKPEVWGIEHISCIFRRINLLS